MQTKQTINQPFYMTTRGQTRLENELAFLRTTKRLDIVERLHDAEGGDWLDNVEYITIQDELSLVDGRIAELDHMLRFAEIIQPGEPDGKIHLGNTVVVQEPDEPPETYTIVGSAEANPDEGLISNLSPLGRALLNHQIGDIVMVQTPSDNVLHFRILAVT